MHLRDARVDLEGRIVGLGSMIYPKDDADAFMLPVHDNICIDIRDSSTFRAATSSRDPESGFLVSALVGPIVILPVSIKAVILETLRAYQPTPLRLQSTDEGGQLVAEGFAKYQPLSDWRLEIDVEQNCLLFRLSAALKMLKPSELRGAGNYWGTTEPTARIDIVFTVDAVTRTALFTVPLAAAEQSPEPRSLLTPPLTNGIRLDDATIDSRGRLYALSAGRAVQLFELSPTNMATLVLEHCSVGRLQNGFLASPPYPVYPRIWLDAVDLATMMRLCDGTSSMDLKDGSFGHLEQHRESDVPTQSIEKVSFRVRVDEAGLTVTYHLFVTNLWHQSGESSYRPDWLDGAFTLPWPTIVLRFPRRHLLSWRRRIERGRA